MEIFTIETDDVNKRVDVFLNEEMEDVSRSALQKNIEKGNITVNGEKISKNYKLRLGDIVEAELPPPENIDIVPEDIPLDIMYEDDDLIVINKSQNMVVHPAPGHYTGTLVNALMFHCGDNLSGINGVLRPGIVHRIDKDTSGVLVIAKSDLAHKGLSEQLAEHSMKRVYNAIVYNSFSEESGTVDRNIDRSKNDRKKMAVVMQGGRNAVTHYKVIEKLGKYTWVELQLETGRTHQIRVHMSYIGHPLLGDPVYGPKKCPFNLNGQVLHAKVLGFIHPRTGEYMEFNSELPDYFSSLIERLKK
ncbi:MAG: RluA family pseudouridine synthase [Clostridia bacterium]|nr:RluA family pseudouridine synthase [Clostridia bacterium]